MSPAANLDPVCRGCHLLERCHGRPPGDKSAASDSVRAILGGGCPTCALRGGGTGAAPRPWCRGLSDAVNGVGAAGDGCACWRPEGG